MCGLKAAQMHKRPFKAAKNHVQSLAALDSPFALRQKVLISKCFIIHANWQKVDSDTIYFVIIK